MSTDDFRTATVVITLIAGLLFRWAIWLRVKTPAAFLVVLVIVINFMGASVALADIPAGAPLVWYRAPRIFAASVIALVYCFIAFRHPRRR